MDILKDMGLYDELIKMAIGPPKENDGLSYSNSFIRLPHKSTHEM